MKAVQLGVVLAVVAAIVWWTWPRPPSNARSDASAPTSRIRNGDPARPSAPGGASAADAATERREGAGDEASSTATDVLCAVRGRAVDVQRRPLGGAVARLIRVDSESSEDDMPVDGAVDSAADGSFRVEGVDPGRARIRLAATGYATRDSPSVTLRAGIVLDVGDVVLWKGGAIAGVVVDAGGRGIAGVEVTTDVGQLARTGDDGAFRLDGLPLGTSLVLRADADGWSTPPPGSFTVDLSPGEPVLENLVLRLTPTAAIRGRVVTDDGAPLPNTIVFARPPAAGDPRFRVSDTTDSDGRFALIGVDADQPYRLWARAAGFGQVMVQPVSTREEVTVVMTGGPAALVTVVDAVRGARIDDAEVTVTDDSDRTALPLGDGVYRLPRGDAEPLTVRAISAGFREGFAALDKGVDSLTLPLVPLKAVNGVVRDIAGRPVTGAAVELWRTRPAEHTVYEKVYGVAVRSPRERIATETSGGEGEFLFTPEVLGWVGEGDAGELELRAWRGDDAYAAISLDESAFAGSPVELWIDATGAIAGAAREAGAIAPGRPVVAHRRDGVYRTAFTDEVGRYAVDGLPPGDYRVELGWLHGRLGSYCWQNEAWSDGEIDALYPVRVTAGATSSFDLEATAAGSAWIDGVLAPISTPFSDLTIEVLWCEEGDPGPAGAVGFGEVDVDDRGAFRVTGLWPSRFSLALIDASTRTLLATDVLIAGPGRHEVALTPNFGAIEGRVFDGHTGRALGGAGLELRRSVDSCCNVGHLRHWRRATPDGSFRVSDLEPGEWRLMVRAAGGYERYDRSITVTADQTATFEARVQPQAAIRLRATSGTWPDDATVAVEGLAGEEIPWSPALPFDGAHTVHFLTGGAYRVRVTRAGAVVLDTEVTVTAGQTAEVDVDM